MSLIELNRLEKAIYYVNKYTNAWTCFCISRLPAQGFVLDALIKQALYYMYKRHPLLRARIQVDGSNNKVFFNIPQESLLESDMNFESCKLSDSSRFIETVEKFTTKEFEYEKDCLLWRMMLIEQEDIHEYVIVLALALYITDGMNICTLSIELVNILNSLLTNQVCDEMLSTLPMIDHTYDLIENAKLFTESDKLKLKEEEEKNKVKFVLSTHFMDENDSGYKLNLLTIDRDVSQNIIKQAKSKNIKLTGYLATALIYALKSLYEENSIPLQDDFSFYISASLRIRMNPEVDFSHCRYLTLPAIVNLHYSTLDQQNRSIWIDSAYANSVLNHKMNTDGDKRIFEDLYDFELADSLNSALSDSPDKAKIEGIVKYTNSIRHCDLVLSNIGSHVEQRKRPLDGALKITTMHIGDTMTSEVCQLSCFIFHVTTWNDQLMIQLGSSRREIASKHSDRLMQLLQSVLENSFKI